MKNEIAGQKNSSEKSHKRGSLSYFKKTFNYLLLLSLLGQNIANAQSNTSLISKKDKAPASSEMTVTDCRSLVDINADSLDIGTIRSAILLEINQERAKKKLGPLVLNEILNKAAEEHGKYMNENNRYNHKDKNGIGARERVKKQGYKKVFMGENIHESPRKIAYVMKSWMGSPLHKNNILGEFAEDVGIYYENGYWVLVFGGRYPRISRDDKK